MYSVYSEFDLEKHKQTYVNYLEVLIDEEGTIMYAVPSHQEKGVKLACARLNVTRQELEARCPKEYYFNFMPWLCMTAKVVFVWDDRCVAENPTIKQIGALRRLKMAGVYHGSIPEANAFPTCLQHLTPAEKDVYLHGAWGQTMLDNNQLAEELIFRYAGLTPQMRTTISQAARRLQVLDIQLNSMASTLKKLYGCGGCVHCNCDYDQEPCNSCRKDGNFPKWEWKGENHG